MKENTRHKSGVFLMSAMKADNIPTSRGKRNGDVLALHINRNGLMFGRSKLLNTVLHRP